VSEAMEKVTHAGREVDRLIFTQQVRPTITPETIAEHRENPFGAGHSPELEILLRYLRRNPAPGKPRYVLVETKPYQEWYLALHPGGKAAPLTVTDQRFTSQAEAQHAIFLARLRDLGDPGIARIVAETGN
jgi:hypothetical protein